jgi:hypothetical protein
MFGSLRISTKPLMMVALAVLGIVASDFVNRIRA